MIIGQHYVVPCIARKRKSGKTLWVPIMGSRHPDPELDNPKPHYHIDYRFFTDKMMLFYFGNRFLAGKIHVFSSPVDLPIKNMRLRCYRHFSTIISADSMEATINEIDFFKFEDLMEKAEVVVKHNCRTCPHKGISLEGAVEIFPGIVECPGHALTWNLSTGKLYKRDRVYRDIPKSVERPNCSNS